MERLGIELEKTLKDEANIIERLLLLEEHKTQAIMEHDGKLLEKLSREQEGLLSVIHSLESDRMNQMDVCKRAMRLNKENATLKDITGSAEKRSGAHLAGLGRQLGELITRLNNLLGTNRMLISDNMEYYNILLKGLRGTGGVDAGYNPEGKEEEILKQSILFNKTA